YAFSNSQRVLTFSVGEGENRGSFATLLQFPDGQKLTTRCRTGIERFVRFWFRSLSKSEEATAIESRLKLALRERDVLESEHRRVVAMNLVEREARLNEHRAYESRLEEEVDARTSMLRLRNRELEHARTEIERNVETLRF